MNVCTSDGEGWIDPNINPEVFDEIALFLEKHYPRQLYPLWYSALEHAAWSATEPRFRKFLTARLKSESPLEAYADLAAKLGGAS